MPPDVLLEEQGSAISVKEARDHLAEIVSRAVTDKERIVLTEHGKRVAAIVPIEDVDLLEELEDRIDLEDARAVLAEVEKEGTVPWETVKAELGL